MEKQKRLNLLHLNNDLIQVKIIRTKIIDPVARQNKTTQTEPKRNEKGNKRRMLQVAMNQFSRNLSIDYGCSNRWEWGAYWDIRQKHI